VKGVAPGVAEISVALDGVSTSTTVTISSSTSGFTFVDDFADSRLMHNRQQDGSIVTYYGTRNADGTAAKITGVQVITTPDQRSQNITFDDQNRPKQIFVADGALFSFDWTSPATPILIGVSADRTDVDAIALSSAQTGSNAAPIKSAASRYDAMETTANTGSSTVFLHVTSCDGAQPEDNASVSVTKSGIFGGDPIEAWSIGSGRYRVTLPAGPTSSPNIQTSLSVLDNLCGLNDNLDFKISNCSAFTKNKAFVGLCLLALGSLKTVCSSRSGSDGLNAVINYLNSMSPSVDILATATLDGTTLSKTLSNQPAIGPYQDIEFSSSFPCQVDHVSVSPAETTIGIGSSQLLTAAAFDKNSKTVTSSSLKWSWSNSDDKIRIGPGGISVPGGHLPSAVGVSDATVTGVGPTATGSPETVTATETTSGQFGTSSITVKMSYSLSVQWTVTPIATDGASWSGTDTLTITNGDWVYLGSLFGGNACGYNRSEHGSGSTSSPQLPATPAPFTFDLSFPMKWTNAPLPGCGATGGGDYTTPLVTILATPGPMGGYSLSTNTVYPHDAYYAGSQMTVTATGSIK